MEKSKKKVKNISKSVNSKAIINLFSVLSIVCFLYGAIKEVGAYGLTHTLLFDIVLLIMSVYILVLNNDKNTKSMKEIGLSTLIIIFTNEIVNLVDVYNRLVLTKFNYESPRLFAISVAFVLLFISILCLISINALSKNEKACINAFFVCTLIAICVMFLSDLLLWNTTSKMLLLMKFTMINSVESMGRIFGLISVCFIYKLNRD